LLDLNKVMNILAKFTKEWGLRLLVITTAMLWIALIAATWAEAGEKDDEYSFNWLDPDKKIYVLQNRKYTKANRLLLSAATGHGFSNPYRATVNVDPRVAYYFSEAIGVEAFYTMTFNTANNTYDALILSGSPVLPIIREIKSQYGVLGHWSPWYGKLNMFNKILYFDWYLSGGAGTVHSTAIQPVTGSSDVSVTQDFFSFFAGAGHQYHLSQSLSVRVDFMGAFYRAPVGCTSGGNTWFSNLNLGIGIGVRI
jgi:outer membrane beta-barrel protein